MRHEKKRRKTKNIKATWLWSPFFQELFLKEMVLSVGKLRACCDSLELRAVSHRTVLLLWDPKRLVRNSYSFEGSKRHLPTLWLDCLDACMTRLQKILQVSSATTSKRLPYAFLVSIMRQSSLPDRSQELTFHQAPKQVERRKEIRKNNKENTKSALVWRNKKERE